MKQKLAVMMFLLLASTGCSTAGEDHADASIDDSGSADTDQDTDSDDPDGGTDDPPPPLFDNIETYQTVIAANGDPADVYYPAPSDLETGQYSFPVALLLQGVAVERQYYSKYASAVSSYGFVVVVPDHHIVSLAGPGLYAEQSEAQDVIAHMQNLNQCPDFPAAGKVDVDTLVLLGHSYGGVAGINIIRGTCEPPTCMGLSYERPSQLAGGAFWGTNVALPFIGTMVVSIANDSIPLALLQGTLDSKALPCDTQEAYTKIQTPPKAYIGLEGTNHYGICDTNNPPGAAPDNTEPTLSQHISIEKAARWSALFLRAHVLEDSEAEDYVHSWGGPADPEIVVVSDPSYRD